MRTPSGVVVLTDRRQARLPLPVVIAAAVAGGARWVLLREKDLPRPERAVLAARLRRILAPCGGRLIVAGPDPLGGDAIHLAAGDACPRGVGGPPDGPLTVGRSCHSVAEVDRLTTEDYLSVSPVFTTASKPGYGPPLEVEGLSVLRWRAGPRPVLALGGIAGPRQVAACFAAGAAGVAVMGAVMRAADPAEVVGEMCQALPRVDQGAGR